MHAFDVFIFFIVLLGLGIKIPGPKKLDSSMSKRHDNSVRLTIGKWRGEKIRGRIEPNVA